ncbi:hypothetical protein [Ruminococcus sp.]|nr:hypothetical protein [Ruminococcus sp.]
MDKEKYISLEMEIVEFETQDVITASGEDEELPVIPNPATRQ